MIEKILSLLIVFIIDVALIVYLCWKGVKNEKAKRHDD